MLEILLRFATLELHGPLYSGHTRPPVAWPERLAPGVRPIPWLASLQVAQSTQGFFPRYRDAA